MDMNKNIIKYISAAVLSFCPAFLPAQNLNPSVEVTKAYEGTLVEVHKPSMQMNVPDSVRTFRLDFDYSVFDSPYKGSYEFTPYLMSMQMASSEVNSQTFFMKMGAGYRLYPVFDLIWTPNFKKGFRMDVYASHNSYIGDYRNIGLSGNPGEDASLVETDKSARMKSCYDMLSRAGVNGRLGWNGGSFQFKVGYYGLAGKYKGRTRGYDAVDASLGVASDKDPERNFVYDVDLAYRFAEDKIGGIANGYLGEHHIKFDADFGPVIKQTHRVLLDVGTEVVSYSLSPGAFASVFHVTPHYVIKRGRLNLDAGVRVDAVVTSKNSPYSASVTGQQIVYPDVRIEFLLDKDALSIYTDVTGGCNLRPYGSLLSENHYVDFLSYGNISVLGCDVERVNAVLGLKGRISSKFSYDIFGGYASCANGMLDGFNELLIPSIGYASYQRAYATARMRWASDRVRFDALITYTHSWDFKGADYLFKPADLTGDVAFEYNWRRRIFAGVDCSFSTARYMASMPQPPVYKSVSVPGYADLGVSFEYAINRKCSVWLRGSNLLSMTIQRTPLYAESGISFTAGFCLSL